MFEAFAFLQGNDAAFEVGKAVGYLLSAAICVTVVVIVPIVWFVRSRRQRTIRVDLFHIHKNGQQCGPYSVDQIRAYISSGEFQLGDLAWYQNAWVPLSSIPGIVAN